MTKKRRGIASCRFWKADRGSAAQLSIAMNSTSADLRFTLDTNVLVYAIDSDAGDRHRIALDVVRRARGKDCIITLQTLAELFRTLTGKGKVKPATAIAVVHGWRDAVPIFAADEICLVDAMDAASDHGWSFGH